MHVLVRVLVIVAPHLIRLHTFTESANPSQRMTGGGEPSQTAMRIYLHSLRLASLNRQYN